MEMHQVRYFLVLARTLNFSRVAEECNVSQPALTRAIQALEAELGGELLRRERQHSHLTELGTRMLPLLQQCYDAASAAVSLARSVKAGEVAPLALAVSRTVNTAILSPLFGELSRAYPGVQLRVKRGLGSEIGRFLKNGEIEIGIAGSLEEEWERLDQWQMFEEPLELLVNARQRLASSTGAPVELDQLDGEQFLVRTGCEMAERIARCLSAKGIRHGKAHEVETDEDLIALLEANLGVAIVPASGPHAAGLCRLALNGLDLQRRVAAYSVAGRRRSHGATILLNLLRAADWSQRISAPA